MAAFREQVQFGGHAGFVECSGVRQAVADRVDRIVPRLCDEGRRGRFSSLLLVVYDTANGSHGFPDATANVTLGFLGLSFVLKVTIYYRLTGFSLDRAGRLFQAAFDPLPVHA